MPVGLLNIVTARGWHPRLNTRKRSQERLHASQPEDSSSIPSNGTRSFRPCLLPNAVPSHAISAPGAAVALASRNPASACSFLRWPGPSVSAITYRGRCGAHAGILRIQVHTSRWIGFRGSGRQQQLRCHIRRYHRCLQERRSAMSSSPSRHLSSSGRLTSDTTTLSSGRCTGTLEVGTVG